MIKRIASLIAALVLCIIILPTNVFEANAEMLTGYPRESSLIDELGIIGEGTPEFNELDALVKETAAKTNLNLTVFIAGKYRPEEAAVIFTEDSYDEIFGEDTDGIFYYMDLSGYHPASDCISCAGRTMLTYPAHNDAIFNTLDQYLPFSGQEPNREDVCTAVRTYLSFIESYSSEQPSKFAYYYHARTGKYYYYSSKGEFTVTQNKPLFVYLKPLGISAIIGFLVALMVYLITKSNYKFKGKPDPKAYVANELSGFRVKNDIFIRTDTHRTRISSNSGGGGGHSGGGGHHHSGGHHTSVHHR